MKELMILFLKKNGWVQNKDTFTHNKHNFGIELKGNGYTLISHRSGKDFAEGNSILDLLHDFRSMKIDFKE